MKLPVRLLYISNLFPNATEPTRGIFNAQQVAALSRHCSIRVIAPTYRDLPTEIHNGIEVRHPRFFHIPVLSRPANGWLFARSIEAEIGKRDFDFVFASWAYPDGYGVMLLAQKYKFPFAVDVLGSDVNCFFTNTRRKKQILRTLKAAKVVFAKSRPLAKRLAEYGIQSYLDYNGVDRERFHPIPREEACRQLGLPVDRRRILYIGNLQPVKGPTVLADAYARLQTLDHSLQTIDLVFIGKGPERSKIEKIRSQHSAVSYHLPIDFGLQSQVSSLRSQVWLLGPRPHGEIPLWMNACDVLCLPSLNEGLPNVCIEAAACGLPVVASNVGGVPEVIKEGINGFLIPPTDPTALATALHRAFNQTWDRSAIARSVATFDWDANARQVVGVLQSVVRSLSSKV